jgi:hypothetical protein
VLTDGARNRAKKPLMAPSFSADNEDPLRTTIRDVLGSESMRTNPFLDHRGVERLADSADADPAATADPLMLMAASLCIIQERYHVT